MVEISIWISLMNLWVTVPSFSGGWTISGTPLDLSDPRILAIAQNVTFWKLSMMSMQLQMLVEPHFAVQLL
jgi:hypothetical protein